jgi:hypothetical protein
MSLTRSLHFAPMTGISTLLVITSLREDVATTSKASAVKKALAFGKLNTRAMKWVFIK